MSTGKKYTKHMVEKRFPFSVLQLLLCTYNVHLLLLPFSIRLLQNYTVLCKKYNVHMYEHSINAQLASTVLNETETHGCM